MINETAEKQPGTDTDEPLVSRLFTVRNRPVLFTKTRPFLSEALTAVERGAFPVSRTGFHSLAGCLYQYQDQPEKPIEEVVTPRFLETLAAGRDRQLREAIARASRAASLRGDGGVLHYITLDMRAASATGHGFFASDGERRDAWQAAYKLYHLICDSGLFIPQKMAGTHHAWPAESCARRLAQSRDRFALLKQFMSGDFDVSKVDPRTLLNLAGGTHYFTLPPKPGGEPVIPPPVITLSFDFINEACPAPDEEDGDDYTDEQPDGQDGDDGEEWDGPEQNDEPHDDHAASAGTPARTYAVATAPTAPRQQLELF